MNPNHSDLGFILIENLVWIDLIGLIWIKKLVLDWFILFRVMFDLYSTILNRIEINSIFLTSLYGFKKVHNRKN